MTGSHDSSAFYLTDGALIPDSDTIVKDLCKIFGERAYNIVHKWSITQTLGFQAQLQAGIRYLDMRLASKSGTEDIYLAHGLYGHTLEYALDEIDDFLNEHPKEVILLDCNHFNGMESAQHLACQKLIQSKFPSKLCPDMSQNMKSLTLDFLWKNNYQVICFYQNGSEIPSDFWGEAGISSPWPNTVDDDTLLKALEAEYEDRSEEKSENSTKFFVYQGLLTPDVKYVVEHVTGTLEKDCAEKINGKFVQWLLSKQAGNHGINVCIMDFVEMSNYIPSVVGLNSMSLNLSM